MCKPWNYSFFLIVVFLLSVPPAPARASETGQPSALRIEKDETRKAFVFVIDGEPAAFLDKTGLHVGGDISYGGALLDEGRKSFETQAQGIGGHSGKPETNLDTNKEKAHE